MKNEELITTSDNDQATGWMDTSWTKRDAQWFERCLSRRGQILQTDMSQPDHRQKTMEFWGGDLAIMAGAGVLVDDIDKSDTSMEKPNWSSPEFSRQWWKDRLNGRLNDQTKTGETMHVGGEVPLSNKEFGEGNLDENPMDRMFREALYQQAEMIGNDRSHMGEARPEGLTVDEWNDLVRLAGNKNDEEDAQELQVLAKTYGRRILFQKDKWPTRFSVFGWSDGPFLHLTIYRLIYLARRQSELKNERLKASFPLHQKIVHSWQQRFRDRKALLEQRRSQNNQAWQKQISFKMCQALDDPLWMVNQVSTDTSRGYDGSLKIKTLALNGWGHLMLGGGHDSWIGWVDAHRAGLWSDLDQ